MNKISLIFITSLLCVIFWSLQGFKKDFEITQAKNKSNFFVKTEGFYQSNDSKPSIARGEKVYRSICISCHQADGSGVPRMNPPLSGTSMVKGDKKILIGTVLNGLKGIDIDDESYSNTMPAQKQLSDLEIADVLTYVRNNFGNKYTAISTAEVKSLRKK